MHDLGSGGDEEEKKRKKMNGKGKMKESGEEKKEGNYIGKVRTQIQSNIYVHA